MRTKNCLSSNRGYGTLRQASLDDINLDQFLKISNYEDTVKQLDIYYGIVKRQLLQIQSPITGLFPVLSTDKEVGSIRDSVYCAAAIWSLYQAYRWELDAIFGLFIAIWHRLPQRKVRNSARKILFLSLNINCDIEKLKLNWDSLLNPLNWNKLYYSLVTLYFEFILFIGSNLKRPFNSGWKIFFFYSI